MVYDALSSIIKCLCKGLIYSLYIKTGFIILNKLIVKRKVIIKWYKENSNKRKILIKNKYKGEVNKNI